MGECGRIGGGIKGRFGKGKGWKVGKTDTERQFYFDKIFRGSKEKERKKLVRDTESKTNLG